MQTTITPGDSVRLHYTSKTADGGVYETSRGRSPLEIVAGGEEIVRGISEGVIGMSSGESRTLTVGPDAGFGERDPGLERVVPRSMLPERIEEGSQLVAVVSGVELDVWVRSLDETEAVVDANHPLAGETLVFDIEIVEFSPAASSEADTP